MKMEGTCSFETSVDFQRTARRYIQEDSSLHQLVIAQLFNVVLLRSDSKLLCGASALFLKSSRNEEL
jgi:hypothetical protein